MQVVDRIKKLGIVPVIRAPSAELASLAIDAVYAGGIDVIEVTMTVPGAVSLIESLVRRYGDKMVIGAGTVLDAETARACTLAGAAFVVSPIVDEGIIASCRTYGVPVLPGALTPTEIVRAVRAGADMVKVFPCGAMGGASYIKSIKAPLPNVHLVPTGGVSEKTAGDFIRAGASAIGVGADLINIDKLLAGDSNALVESARRYVAAVQAARGVAAA